MIGDNGVLTQAQKAKEKTDFAKKKEESDFKYVDNFAKSLTSGISVEQVTDTNPGALEQEGSSLVISSIEDLVVFAYNVRNGNTYNGQTVKLGLDLDFCSVKSYVEPFRTDYGVYGYSDELMTLLTSGEGFVPIGTTSNLNVENYSFAGTFDGSNKTINNLYMNRTKNANDEMRLALFGNNNGIIKNLKLINVDATLKVVGSTGDLSGIASKNLSSIENCSVVGNLNIIGTEEATGAIRIGGISATNNSNIQNCSFSGTINYSNSSFGGSYQIGGIAGGSSGSVLSCCNFGKIEVYDGHYLGGIVGLNSGIIRNCYNANDVYGENTYYIGGIAAGNSNAGLAIEGCYNYASVTGVHYNKRGDFIGSTRGSLNNNYYMGSDSITGIGEIASDANNENIKVECKSSEEMQSYDFVDTLNEGLDTPAWKKDTGINNGYPILIWQ